MGQPATENPFISYKVVGVIGTDDSATSGPVAQVLSVANIPLVSFWASSDALSDKQHYPNFWRVLASDTYLIIALTEFLRLHDLNYVSIIFDKTPRSLGLYKTLRSNLAFKKICISRKLITSENTNLTEMLGDILEDNLASRIILFMGGEMLAKKVMTTVKDSIFQGQFLWIANDYWVEHIFKDRAPRGSVGVHYKSIPVPNFKGYFHGLGADNKNPWFMKALDTNWECAKPECIKRVLEKALKKTDMVISLMYDCPYVFAHAMDAFIKDKCSDLYGSMVSKCFYDNYGDFVPYLRNVKFERNSHVFRFTKDGQAHEMYSLIQSAYDVGEQPLEIAQYSLKTDTTTILHPIMRSQLLIPFERLQPQTFCTKPCSLHKYRYAISRCCWICRECQENEVVADNRRTCEQCPTLYWPYIMGNNSRECRRIPPDHFRVLSATSIVLTTVATMGILTVMFILLVYWKKRTSQVIKASSIELSMIQLIFIGIGYLTVPVVLDRPTTLRCTLGVLLFTTSFDVLYVTMLMKAIRVYRIFNMSRKQMVVTYTSRGLQIFLCGLLIVFEVVRFVLLNEYYPIEAAYFQPDFNVEYVEWACTIPSAHLIPFCVFDIILLFSCSIYAFKTQTLPNKFKESRFVSMCVITTLIVWVVFIPSYFTTVRWMMKMFFILLALLINNTMALVFLFFTRILALKNVSRRAKRHSSLFA